MGGAGGAHLELVASHDAPAHGVGDGDFREEVLAQAGRGGHPAYHAARPFDVAGHAQQADDGPQGLAAVGLPLQGTAELDAARRIDGEHPGGFDDVFGLEPGNLRGAFRGVLLDPLLELVEAVGPVVDKIPVPEAFVDDNVHHSQGQRGIRAGADLQPQRRP